MAKVRVLNVSDFIHKKVKLKNGLDGVLLGLYQKIDSPMLFSIEYWCSNGKREDWYKSDEFYFLEE